MHINDNKIGGNIMNKRDKYFFAVSLGIAISSQNVISISNAESLKTITDIYISIASDDN